MPILLVFFQNLRILIWLCNFIQNPLTISLVSYKEGEKMKIPLSWIRLKWSGLLLLMAPHFSPVPACHSNLYFTVAWSLGLQTKVSSVITAKMSSSYSHTKWPPFLISACPSLWRHLGSTCRLSQHFEIVPHCSWISKLKRAVLLFFPDQTLCIAFLSRSNSLISDDIGVPGTR